MNKVINNVVKLFWHDSDETNVKAIQGTKGRFDLMLGTLLVGTLIYSDGKWTFSYSETYKAQDKYKALTNFPSLNQVYENTELWPFFTSRLPGNAQRTSQDEQLNPIELLQKYGRHVITNPYTLIEGV